MHSTQWTRRGRDAERVAEQAWHNLVSAVESASDTTKDRVGSAANEAGHRARAALDALAGRREQPPWAMIVGLTAAAFAIGWLAATATRRTMLALSDEPVELDLRPDNKHDSAKLRT